MKHQTPPEHELGRGLNMSPSWLTVPPRGRTEGGGGSGGRIRTSDLWVMSPTSCHCSTPRQGRRWVGSGVGGRPDRGGPPGPSAGTRGGLASRRVAPPVLSGAAVFHDRVRDGTGWAHRARDHERRPTVPASPPRSGPPAHPRHDPHKGTRASRRPPPGTMVPPRPPRRPRPAPARERTVHT